MVDAMLVAEVLLSLVLAESPPPLPLTEKSAKNNGASPALRLEWSVRQHRSKQVVRKKGEPARASPTTPLSWSGGTSVCGCGGADGSEQSSRPHSKPVDNARSKTAFTTKKDYGKGEREAQWALAQHTLHGLTPPEMTELYERSNYRELSEIAEQARKSAEVARLRELHTLKGHVESVLKLKGLDIDTIQQHYTV